MLPARAGADVSIAPPTSDRDARATAAQVRAQRRQALVRKGDLGGCIRMARATLPRLRCGALIITAGAATGPQGIARMLGHAAGQGAIHAWTRSLASHRARSGTPFAGGRLQFANRPQEPSMVTISSPTFSNNPDAQPGGSSTDSSLPGANGSKPDALLQTMAEGAHQTIDRLAEQAKPQVQRLQHTMAGTTGMLEERADQIRVMTDDWLESLRCRVRGKPLAAVGAALAVGLLVARLSR